MPATTKKIYTVGIANYDPEKEVPKYPNLILSTTENKELAEMHVLALNAIFKAWNYVGVIALVGEGREYTF